MSEADTAVGTEEDDAAVAAEAVVEIGDGFAGGEFGRGSCSDAVSGPFAEDELHDGFAPAGERDSCGEIVSIATATDERGVSDAAGSLVERAAGGGGGGQIAVNVESYGADRVVRAVRGVLFLEEDGSQSSSGFRAFVVVEDVGRCFFGTGEGFVFKAGGLADLGVGKPLAFAV